MNKDDIIRMAREAGTPIMPDMKPEDALAIAFALGKAEEREACAKVCDSYDVADDVCSSDTAEGIAIAIRARGQA